MKLENLIIDDQYFSEILSIAGYPLITNDDGENDFELSNEQIKSLVIIPCLREYYKYFPLQDIREYSVSGNYSFDFPTPYTFGVVSANLNTVGQFTTVTASNAFIRSRYYSKTSEYGPGMYGTRNSYGIENATILKDVLNQSYVTKFKALRMYPNVQGRKLTGYSNTMGKISVVWANWSEDFNDIPFEKINDVIKFCQSKLLRQLVLIRGQISSELPNEYSISLFQEMSDKLEEEVMKKWQSYSKAVVSM